MDLEEIEKRWIENGDILPADTNDDIYWLISRCRQLEEAIGKHRERMGMAHPDTVGASFDRELYAVLDKKPST